MKYILSWTIVIFFVLTDLLLFISIIKITVIKQHQHTWLCREIIYCKRAKDDIAVVAGAFDIFANQCVIMLQMAFLVD